MADYDIEEAFEAIEKELIDSMMRNLERHKAEEDEEGFNWTMWQAEQLKSLQEYKKRNKDKFGKEFEYINKRIEMFIKGSRRKGQLDQERKILKALKEGKARAKGEPGDVSGNFFRINDRKLNALIKAITNDFEKAETAMLRRADDQYRKIIYNAQVYANTGAGTYEKAVDMATKDFLSRGIDCIEYKNGSRHNIRDYARMCLRTAGKRAYLTGEGESRQERGLHLVIINKRGNPCPLCAKWLGKVLIDDVWSGGSKKDGDYPLMSQAIAEKLFHPMCEDVCDTYFDDGFDDWYDSASKEERKEMLERYNNGQKMNYAKRQAEKYGRLEEYSLDEDNKKKYKARKEEWKEKEEKYEEKYEQKSIEIIEDVPKEDVKPRKVYKAKELDNMSLAKLRKISEELATEYYESGISGISFGKTEPAMAAKMLAAMGSKTSLKKDILSIQKSLKEFDKKKAEEKQKAKQNLQKNKNKIWKNEVDNSEEILENDDKSSTMKLRSMANGLRRSPSYILSEDEIESIRKDAKDIGIPENVLQFNKGHRTGFNDLEEIINIRGDVLPDINSNNLRDLLSQKAVLAHEYYGHYKSHPSNFEIDDWRDEFRASYRAAIETPNLSDEERRMLMLDAYDRAKEAGVRVNYNSVARRLIYGYE